MGGITSIATTAIQALGAVNSVLGSVDNYYDDSGKRAYEQTKSMQRLELQQAKERAASDKAQINLASEQADKERRDGLRRIIAKQRAAYGSEGISTQDGSARAVLLGMFDESDDERVEREALDNLKKAAIDQNISQIQRMNTLQLTQLKEKNKIKKAQSAFDMFSDIFG